MWLDPAEMWPFTYFFSVLEFKNLVLDELLDNPALINLHENNQ